jgi:primosomal protein N'
VAALRAGHSANHHLLSVLADHVFRPYVIDVSELTASHAPLGNAQSQAVARACAVSDVLLITAAPGTGKARTVVEIAYQCVERGERVLIVSPTRLGAAQMLDMLSDRLHRQHLPCPPNSHQ